MSVKINARELESLLAATPASQNIMLTGKHGIGKSQILEKFFTARGERVVILFLGQMSDPGDLIGLPRLDEMSGKKKPDYADAKDSGLKAEQYYNYMTTKDWDLDESGKPVKSELMLYLNEQDLTDAQRSVIFGKLSNAKNPYEDGTAHSTDWQAEFDSYLANKDKESSGSNKSKGGSRRRRSGGGSGSKKARAKTDSEKRFSNLQKMKAPTTGKGIEALSSGAKGLTKAQKKALIKLLQKKLDV